MRTHAPLPLSLAVLLTASLSSAWPATAQQLAISEARQDCILRAPYPMLAAVIEPAEQVVAAWLHFRAAQSPGFHWLRMQAAGDRFEAVLPVPAPDTTEIVYFVEAAPASGEPVRTEPHTVRVVDDEQGCDDPAAGTFGGDPRIVVAGPPGAPAVPPGFEPTGIAGALAVRRGFSPWLAALGMGGIIVLEEAADEDRPVSPTVPP